MDLNQSKPKLREKNNKKIILWYQERSLAHMSDTRPHTFGVFSRLIEAVIRPLVFLLSRPVTLSIIIIIIIIFPLALFLYSFPMFIPINASLAAAATSAPRWHESNLLHSRIYICKPNSIWRRETKTAHAEKMQWKKSASNHSHETRQDIFAFRSKSCLRSCSRIMWRGLAINAFAENVFFPSSSSFISLNMCFFFFRCSPYFLHSTFRNDADADFYIYSQFLCFAMRWVRND